MSAADVSCGDYVYGGEVTVDFRAYDDGIQIPPPETRSAMNTKHTSMLSILKDIFVGKAYAMGAE